MKFIIRKGRSEMTIDLKKTLKELKIIKTEKDRQYEKLLSEGNEIDKRRSIVYQELRDAEYKIDACKTLLK